MKRTLILLVTSERPDTYLNSVVHGLLREGVRAIEFVYIQGFGGAGSQSAKSLGNKKSADVMRRVHVLLESLANLGEYRHFTGNLDRVDLRSVYGADRCAAIQKIYEQCLQLEVQWSHRDISYLNLKEEIEEIARNKHSSVLDVSSVKKRYLGDLVAASVVVGLNSLYTFDLADKPDFDAPWRTLYHELVDGDSGARYEYINLLDTKVFQDCARSLLVRRPSLSISLGVGVVLLALTFLANHRLGPSNSFVQGMFIVSAVTSLLSFYYVLFPVRR